MPSPPALRNGFAWWLPPLTAVLGALIAVVLSQSTSAAWDADVHLWASDGRPASEYATLLLDNSVQQSATNGMMASEEGLPRLDGVAVELNDTLIRVTVRAPRQSDAEALALSLAHAAVDEARIRFGDESGLDLLGLVQPGARKVSPTTEWSAAWASAVGLLVGLALAATTARVVGRPRTTLGRLGGVGLRPIAVITREAERGASTEVFAASGSAVGATLDRARPDDDAVLLANVMNPVSGIVAFVPLDDDSGVTATLIQAARTLAARGNSVIWLDGRRPAFELEYGTPPMWLFGADWSPVDRSRLILRSAAQALRPNGYVLLPTDPLSDPSALELARSAVGVILLARADASEDELVMARDALSSTRLLGVALTLAQDQDIHEFEQAHTTE